MSTEMQQNRSGKSVVKEELESFNYGKRLAIYIHLRQTLIGQPAISSVAAGVAVCCRICSTTVNRLISAAVIVSYLKQNSRLSDDNSGRWWKVSPALLPRYMDLTECGSVIAVDILSCQLVTRTCYFSSRHSAMPSKISIGDRGLSEWGADRGVGL